MGCLVIVCGLPGSGKTTVATSLARERGGIRLGPDEWMVHLGASLWDSQLRGRVEALQWYLAKDLLALGLTVVIEWGTWARSERDALRVEARELGARVELIHLDIPVADLWRRIQARGLEKPAIQRADLDEWVGLFEAPDGAELASYDTS